MIHFLICLLITVGIHELAHLIVALCCGIGVKAFSFGFGKPYLHKTIKGIDYRLSPIPLGGYCDIQGFDTKNNPKDFLTHPYPHKLAVLLAGVTANILLAFIIYLFQYGSIRIGIIIDWECIKAIFTKDYTILEFILRNVPINLFLMQLSLLNFFSGVSNLIPIVPLDGGYIWYFLIEHKLSKLTKKILHISGWIFLIVIQTWLIYWIYFWR